jgi:hypothetical protein
MESPSGSATLATDAGKLLGVLPERLEAEDVLALADFAFGAGHYEVAGDLYQRWYGAEGESVEAGRLNGVAWNLTRRASSSTWH